MPRSTGPTRLWRDADVRAVVAASLTNHITKIRPTFPEFNQIRTTKQRAHGPIDGSGHEALQPIG
jgi:hypothetical protein